MATHAERRAVTRGAVLRSANELFSGQGFAATTIDDIAAAAGVAKGAVYHHFSTKEVLFEAVFDDTSRAVAQRLAKAAPAEPVDILKRLAAGARAYFAACAEPATFRIILKDGPLVLGWARWREIDMRDFGHFVPRALKAAMKQGLIAKQPVEPLARLIVGAITEAAMACAESDNPARTGKQHVSALETLLEGLRLR